MLFLANPCLLFALTPPSPLNTPTSHYPYSFNNVQYWMENIAKHANPTTRKLLVGNKIDVKGKRVRVAFA